MLSALAQKTYTQLYERILAEENLKRNLCNSKSSQAFLNSIEQEGDNYIIALDDEKFVGYVGLRDPVFNFIGRMPTEKDQALNGIYVDYDYHQQGIAHTLLDKAFEMPRFQQAENVYLFVWHENIIAYNFYLKYGFDVVGKKEIFNKGTMIGHDLVMIKKF